MRQKQPLIGQPCWAILASDNQICGLAVSEEIILKHLPHFEHHHPELGPYGIKRVQVELAALPSESPDRRPGTVELRPAFEFTCEECGQVSYASSRVLEREAWSEEQRYQVEEVFAELRRAGDLPDGAELGGHWMTSPSRVSCAHCGSDFETREMSDDVE
jgi:hypothetical protein